ncbi:short-chain dehydrogenase/reductase [Nibricoccus aquaticus]|uniref:Short-chain dehydrogenase/reductase n=1 Tax=Nibricoccus aquaticus TaxID=2576891 RepID=A0A290Q5E1_9BACT|nr:oxidoreductase [Nibricoccus aquaticus]ATC63653.1 short-chain dehydrogenase/reductase [Nibricoccus aquaticus]
MPASILKNKTALVTGASSGIGREIAQLLAERGARVFGTARNPQSATPIPGVEMIAMDVTDDASVAGAVRSIVQKAGPIHFVVNNAGYGLTGAVEETSLAEARQQFETNFFGTLRVTNAVLPEMRRAGFGRFANISSVVGFLPAPFMSMYSASKHAMEGYTESLDHEVRRFGVRALLIEPSFTKSNISHSGKDAELRLDDYSVQRDLILQATRNGIATGDDPRLVAETVFTALTASSPRLRYPVGKGVTLSRLRRFLPAGVFDRAIRKQFQLN